MTMKRFIIFLSSLFLLFTIAASSASAQQKLAQTGMKFISVGPDPRIAAVGEAVTALEGTSTAMFYNPAGMARLSSFADISFGRVNWIADINHDFGSIAFSPFHGDYGVFGVTLRSVDYGELQETVRANNEQGFLDVGTFKPTAFAVGVVYARALSDRFAVGGNVNFVYQSLGMSAVGLDSAGNLIRVDNKLNVPSFDFGIIYKTGFKSLAFGMSVRNFARELKYRQESFQLPLIFRIGFAMDVLDLTDVDKDMHSLLLSVDATHPRDYPEQVNIGAEYRFAQIVMLRAGYMFNNDEYGFTAGIGLQKEIAGTTLGFDYSFTPFKTFANVHRLGFHFSL